MSNSSSRKDNLVIAVSKAIQHFKIPITSQSIKQQINTHPDYPTLKSVTDTLDHFNIKNYPIRVTPEELAQIDQPFLVHTFKKDDELQFVEKRTNKGFLTFGNSKKAQTLTTEEFLSTFSGVVILIDPSSEARESDFKSKKHLEVATTLWLPALSLFALLALVLTLWQSNLEWYSKQTLLIGTKLLGLCVSLLLVAKDLKSDFSFTNKLCRIGKKADCDPVTNHSSSTVFAWIKWSDLGFIYFLSGLFLAASGNAFSPIVKLLSITALPYLFYSLYLQAIIIKKWCPLCLVILLVIILEFGLTLSATFEIATPDIFQSLLYISVITTLFLLSKSVIKTQRQTKDLTTKYRRLKRTPGVLECILKREQFIEPTINSRSLLFGHALSDKIRISAFLSFDCSYCAEIFQKLKKLISNSENLQLHIVPVTKNDSRQKEFTAKLYQTYQTHGQKPALTLLDQWYSAIHKFEYDKTFVLSTDEKAFMRDNSLMALNSQISGFPAVFVQGYKLPANYQINELSEFTKALSQIPQIGSNMKKELIN